MTRYGGRGIGYWILFGALFSSTFLAAQSPEELVALQQQKLAIIYAQEYGDMGKLIHGKVYEDYYTAAKGNPFWLSAEWTLGSLRAKQVYYPELLLRYDAYQDALVFAADMIEETFIWVNENQVISFGIRGRQFRYLGRGKEEAALKAADLNPGYFELLYEGKSTLYVKREKLFRPYRDTYEYTGEFYENSVYLLWRNQTCWIIKGKRDVLQFTQDHQTEMEPYIKQQGIRFGSISDDQWIELISYYDSL